jgi:hypothetical protein
VHAILTGDLNIQSSNEPSYQSLLAPGDGQVFDPINAPGTWHDNVNYRSVHTQAPSADSMPGLIGGGMDDRFDFQLVTGEFLDGDGMDYISGSYRAFGNNGTHLLGGDISSGTGASPAVLSALMTASDHLPVVADYQLPAVLGVTTATIPTTLQLGQDFQLAVTVTNEADVLVPWGADELDYSLSGSGDIAGMFTASDPALGTGNVHWLTLDTATPGMKTGQLTILSDGQGVAGGLAEIPIAFNVVAGLPGDYNANGIVDAADFVVWRDNLDQSATLPNDNSHGMVTQADYDMWRANFGSSSGANVAHVVPEPAMVILVLTAASLLTLRRRHTRSAPALLSVVS